ncbi:MAG: FitA-like ribbon-helix-helix domain-containing protein [Frankiaceae bacterium]
MRDILIRNVPDDVHESLRALAAKQGKSLQELLLAQLTDIARPARARALLNEVMANKRASLTAEQIVAALHEGRRY